MSSTPLQYQAAPPRPLWRRVPKAVWLALVAFVVGGGVSLLAPVKQVEYRIDEVTGSQTSRTLWFGCVTTGNSVSVSPVQLRLEAAKIAWTPRWTFLSGRDENVWGRVMLRECNSAPPVYSLGPAQPHFVAAVTDAELSAFVQTLQSGTDAEQRAAVDRAAETAFAQLDSTTGVTTRRPSRAP